MKMAIALAVMMLVGCNEKTHQQIMFSDCIYGKSSPEYAEVVRACADVAVKLRDQSKEKSDAR